MTFSLSTTLRAPTRMKYIDTIHSCIQLNPTLESSNSVNFLDLSITRNPTHLNIGLYRKPTTTDTTINFLSNHPLEHRMAAYNFLIRRMLTLLLNAEQQRIERKQILHIAHSNSIPINMLPHSNSGYNETSPRQNPPYSHPSTNTQNG